LCVGVRGEERRAANPEGPVAVERSGARGGERRDPVGRPKPKGSNMFKKLSNTQLVALGAAARREDRWLAPPPKLRGGALRAFAAKLIGLGLVREVRAKETSPIWRTDAVTGRTCALKLTARGEAAVAEPEAESGAKITTRRPGAARTANAHKRPPANPLTAVGVDAKGPDTDKPDDRSEPRANSKLALLLSLLSRDRGATIAELTTATGWLPHTTRAALTRLRQRGFGLERLKGEAGGGSIFRVLSDRHRAKGAAR
jgi:Protein of unknown function (DUF3489)